MNKIQAVSAKSVEFDIFVTAALFGSGRGGMSRKSLKSTFFIFLGLVEWKNAKKRIWPKNTPSCTLSFPIHNQICQHVVFDHVLTNYLLTTYVNTINSWKKKDLNVQKRKNFVGMKIVT